MSREKTLVFLVGPPAVGKMAVGRELSRLTGLPLYHNHVSIEAVLPVFGYGDPAFTRLVTMQRREMIREVARSALPGLIFTFVWAFNAPEELDYVRSLVEPFEARGDRVVYAELWADLETRLVRNESASRLDAKPSKRAVTASRDHLIDVESTWQFDSQGRFPLSPHCRVDNTALTPTEAATRIVEALELTTDGPGL